MMCSLIEVSVKYVSKVLFTLFIRMSKCTWVDCLCIRDSVKCKLVRKLTRFIIGVPGATNSPRLGKMVAI